jgi:nicotinamide-nucleotide amidase
VVTDADDADELGALLAGRQLATAESLTGGLVAQAMAAEHGSSAWYRGGVVAYQRETKFGVLGVGPGPVVTERAACEMAIGVAELLDARVAVSLTGAAGPDPHDGAPPGTVVIATLVDGHVTARKRHFDGSPERVCEQARDEAMRALRSCLSIG